MFAEAMQGLRSDLLEKIQEVTKNKVFLFDSHSLMNCSICRKAIELNCISDGMLYLNEKVGSFISRPLKELSFEELIDVSVNMEL